MEFTVAVLYKGALTHYTVTDRENDSYEAGLLKYNGNKQHEPPQRIWFTKQGRHCNGNIDDQDLMDEIYYAVLAQKEKGPKVPYVHIY
jgi:hypothetical protein